MSEACVPVSKSPSLPPTIFPSYPGGCQNHDWVAGLLTVFLCCGLVVSYVPQVSIQPPPPLLPPVGATRNSLAFAPSTTASSTKARPRGLAPGSCCLGAPLPRQL